MMSTTVFQPGNTALITGAGSGIGFAVAQLCHAHHMNLVLVDIDADHLALAHQLLANTSASRTITHDMDVGDESSWEYLKKRVHEIFPNGIDLLVLNAGNSVRPHTTGKPWEDLEYFRKVSFSFLSLPVV